MDADVTSDCAAMTNRLHRKYPQLKVLAFGENVWQYKMQNNGQELWEEEADYDEIMDLRALFI